MAPFFEFPPDFVWGCATAAYQIEGATDEDGRGASIWDTFCDKAGAIRDGDTGRIACDHYHRWREDLDIMSGLGIRAYRFSVSWPRVFPSGSGTLNEKGIGFYDRLVDGLLERNIRPFLTCYHWDLPQACEDRGGWRVRETPEAFAEYCGTLAARLGDRVTDWFTINELWCAWWLGYVDGIHAPGAREPERVHRQVCHNMLLGHGLAVRAIRAGAPRPVRVGIVPNPGFAIPFTEGRDDVDFARAEFERGQGAQFGPLFRGAYPAGLLEEWGSNAPVIAPGDMAAISEPTDFVGLNYYSSPQVASAAWGVRDVEPWYPRTDFPWAVVPEVLYWGTRFMHELYGPREIVIAENGCCFPDRLNAEGRVEDYARVGFLRGYLAALHRAVTEGIPVTGYFYWSLMDNFEWQYGFAKRFGLVHVDYDTLARTPKASALWYSRLIAANGF